MVDNVQLTIFPVSDTVDDIALFGFVSKSVCLVRMR